MGTHNRSCTILTAGLLDLAPGTSMKKQKTHLVVLPQKRLERVHAHGVYNSWGVGNRHLLRKAEVVGGSAALLQYLRLDDPPLE